MWRRAKLRRARPRRPRAHPPMPARRSRQLLRPESRIKSRTASRVTAATARVTGALLRTAAGCLPTIGHLAERLFLRHHSAVELVNRLQSLDLVSREPSAEDARQVLVQLTPKGKRILHQLSIVHRTELEETGPKLAGALRAIGRKPRLTHS